MGSFVLEQLIETRFIGYNGSEVYFLQVEQAFFHSGSITRLEGRLISDGY